MPCFNPSSGLAAGLAALVSCAAIPAEARSRVVDHRGVPPVVGQARPPGPAYISQGTRIKCVIPFCSHDFRPQRERVRDHRQPPQPDRPPKPPR